MVKRWVKLVVGAETSAVPGDASRCTPPLRGVVISHAAIIHAVVVEILEAGREREREREREE